ncbi:hypothetical protein LBMAG42_11190 [Deltaproteobacteria bacterium]|nr:hypothetical protein LBMAG42_11190 [Deltaproteobacteria bacterium]
MVPTVCFAAPSGTGKTTLIEGVIRHLTARQVRVGVLKHDAHRLELDRPGKDTWRFRSAGAWRAVIAGESQLAVFSAMEAPCALGSLIDGYLQDADIVLTEGFRKSGLPTIRVVRAAASVDPGWAAPPNVIAWAADRPIDTRLPVLPLNHPEAVADWLFERFLAPKPVEATLALWAPEPRHIARMAEAASRLSAVGRVMVVTQPGVTLPRGLRLATAVRPGLAGAVATALVAADTPDVLFLSPDHASATLATLAALRAGPADVVTLDPPDPGLARYSHRCLPALQSARHSGEPDAWWGAVRVARVSTVPAGAA